MRDDMNNFDHEIQYFCNFMLSSKLKPSMMKMMVERKKVNVKMHSNRKQIHQNQVYFINE